MRGAICQRRMESRYKFLYFFIAVSVISGVAATCVGFLMREKGCHCASRRQGSICCSKDDSGRLCEWGCVCSRFNDNYRISPVCRRETYGLQGAPAIFTAISGCVAGVTFVLALVCGAVVCLWDTGSLEVSVPSRKSHSPHRTRSHGRSFSPAQVVKEETISL